MKNTKLWLVVAVLVVIGLVWASMPADQGGGGVLEAQQVYTVKGLTSIDYSEIGKVWIIDISQRTSGDIIKANLVPDNGDKIQSGNELVDQQSGTAQKTAEIVVDPVMEACGYTLESDPNLDKLYQYQTYTYTQYQIPCYGDGNTCGTESLNWFTSHQTDLNSVAADCKLKGDSPDKSNNYIGYTKVCNDLGVSCQPYVNPVCVYPKSIGRAGRISGITKIFATDVGIKIGSTDYKYGTLTNSAFCTSGTECGAAVNLGTYGKAFWYGNMDTGAYCPLPSEQILAAAYLTRLENTFLFAAPLTDGSMFRTSTLEATPVPSNSSLEFGVTAWNFYDANILKLRGEAGIKLQRDQLDENFGGHLSYYGGYGIRSIPNIIKSKNTAGALFAFYGDRDGIYPSIINPSIVPKKPSMWNGNSQVISTTRLTIGSGSTNLILSADPGTWTYPQFKVEIYDSALPIQSWYIDPQVCKPKLEITTSNPTISGTSKTTISFKATNDVGGSNLCNMEALVNCRQAYSGMLAKPLGTFVSGQSKAFTLDFGCVVSESTTDTCTVTLRGARGEQVSLPMTVICNPDTSCTPNKDSCEGNYKVHCKADGTYDMSSIVYCDSCQENGDGTVKCQSITKRETICNDQIDNDADGKIDCQDEDCKGVCGGGGGYTDPIFCALVAGLVAMLASSYVVSTRKKKDKMKVALIAGVLVFVIVFAMLYLAGLAVQNPFDALKPNITDCATATAGAWLPFDRWGCDLGNALEAGKYVICLIIAGAVVFFAYRIFMGIPEFKKMRLVVFVLLIMAFLMVLWISLMLFWFAVLILILFAIFKFFLAPLGIVGKIAGGLR